MAPTFKGVAGSIAISCQDPQAGSFAQDCAVDLTGLPIASVQATCTTSECYDENNGAVELGFGELTHIHTHARLHTYTHKPLSVLCNKVDRVTAKCCGVQCSAQG